MQNFTRALNKEILYATEDLSWSDEPNDAIVFGQWGIHYKELRDGMQYHFERYRGILEREEETEKYPNRQIRNMRAYTQECMEDQRKEILERLREWHGEEKYQTFLHVIC